MKENIKVGFCVAYDWPLLKKSLPRVYESADIICLSLDAGRTSWSGTPFDFDSEAFYNWVSHIDKDKKIKIYEDNFYRSNYSPIENDNYQRKKMAEYLGTGGWHIQIDADEYFLDFGNFVKYLDSLIQQPTGLEKPINVSCNWVSLIKKTDRGYIYVKNRSNKYETVPFATTRPEYLNARVNSHFNHISPFFVLHETWARGEEQLWQKINSWGHDNDFGSKKSYFNLWKALDENNFYYIKNFHPLEPPVWQQLGFIPETEIEKAIHWLELNGGLHIDGRHLKYRNSRFLQSLKQHLNLK